jgi:hypothetical protein
MRSLDIYIIQVHTHTHRQTLSAAAGGHHVELPSLQANLSRASLVQIRVCPILFSSKKKTFFVHRSAGVYPAHVLLPPPLSVRSRTQTPSRLPPPSPPPPPPPHRAQEHWAKIEAGESKEEQLLLRQHLQV